MGVVCGIALISQPGRDMFHDSSPCMLFIFSPSSPSSVCVSFGGDLPLRHDGTSPLQAMPHPRGEDDFPPLPIRGRLPNIFSAGPGPFFEVCCSHGPSLLFQVYFGGSGLSEWLV